MRELLESLCDELGVPYGDKGLQSVKQYIDVLNKHLLATHQRGRSTVVIIDEAQNLSPAVLEQIRLLTNLETNDKKLLRIILLGQPELGDMLARTELRQLAQRITARYHLTTLSKSDVRAYVAHRLTRAGGNPGIFTTSALNTLYRLSKGTPRLINVIADRAMLGAYVEGKFQVNARLVRTGAREVLGSPAKNATSYFVGAAAFVLVIAGVMAWAYFSRTTLSQAPASMTQKSLPAPPALTPLQNIVYNQPQVPDEQSQEQESRRLQDLLPAADVSRTAEPEAEQTEAWQSVDLTRPPGRPYQLQRDAYRAVFAEWGADYADTSSLIPCDYAPKVGLQCLSRKGSWSEIAALNTPVVLELWDKQSSPYYAALLSISGDKYRIWLGERTFTATPRDLRDNWFGSYVLLWQTPPDYNGSLREGDNHPTVKWLYERLQEIRPQAELNAPQRLFSAELREAVIDFQTEEGLLADGIVGPLTWIRLSDRLNLPAPKLSS